MTASTDSKPAVAAAETSLQPSNNTTNPAPGAAVNSKASKEPVAELSASLIALSIEPKEECFTGDSSTTDSNEVNDRDSLAEKASVSDETGSVSSLQPNDSHSVRLLARNGEYSGLPSVSSDRTSPAIVVSTQEPFDHQIPYVIGDPTDQPDPRLLDALVASRDRIFVIRLEKDIVNFIKDKVSETLDLPQLNSYHRMLAHKMAEYYRLTHVSDASGTSVRMFRGQAARMPPTQLCDWPVVLPQQQPKATQNGAAPPVKIMRRTTPSEKGSETPGKGSSSPKRDGSEASSEHGDSGSTSNKTSREEREAAYQEARARIFKDFVESPPETPPPTKQEKTKRRESPDDFSGRSQFYPVMTAPAVQQPPAHYYPQAMYPDPSYSMSQPQLPQHAAPPRFNPLTANFTPSAPTFTPSSAHQSFIPPTTNRSFPPYHPDTRSFPTTPLPPQQMYPPQQQQPRQPYFPHHPAPLQNGACRPTMMQTSYSTSGATGYPQHQSQPMPQQQPLQMHQQYPMHGQRAMPGWGAAGGVAMHPRSNSAPGVEGVYGQPWSTQQQQQWNSRMGR